jgi:septin family protein
LLREAPPSLLWCVRIDVVQVTLLMFLKVAGESGLGKTTFINTLFSTTIKNYADHKKRHAKQVDKTVEIEITKAELEEKFFKGNTGNNRTTRKRS